VQEGEHGAVAADLATEFERRFGAAPVAAALAPGRVNLIGEHTDYNQGLVLPCAIDLRTLALLKPGSGTAVRVFSREVGEQRSFDSAAPRRQGAWVDYVQGVVAALAERGVATGGFDLAVAGDVPAGSGLSSSAALELAVVTALDAALGLGLDALSRARVAHRAESGFAGVACGVMDQFASALGRAGRLLRIDCRDESVEHVVFPSREARLLVVHAGSARELAHAGYARRVAECRAALEQARAAGLVPRDAASLRALGSEDLPALARALDAVSLRRARHVLSENARVDAVCGALRGGDLEGAGALLREGMASLRDDYEVSTPELDLVCAEADALPGVLGSRLTGAGFGGCTVHLVRREAAREVAERLAPTLEARLGRRPPLWLLEPCAGAAPLALAPG
jgi:galactokinase